MAFRSKRIVWVPVNFLFLILPIFIFKKIRGRSKVYCFDKKDLASLFVTKRSMSKFILYTVEKWKIFSDKC